MLQNNCSLDFIFANSTKFEKMDYDYEFDELEALFSSLYEVKQPADDQALLNLR